MKKIYGIILAGGKGKRFKSDIPKQFVKIGGKYIIQYTIEKFHNCEKIDEIIISINSEYKHLLEEIILKNDFYKVTTIVDGGETRQESSFNAIKNLEDDSYVLIHDAVRPFISKSILKEIIDKLKYYNAIDVAIPSSDTIIKVKNDFIEEIPERKYYYQGQTPQAFKTSLLKQAHKLAYRYKDFDFTDDCGLIKKFNLSKIFVVKGDEKNIKITYPIDLYMAEKIIQFEYLNCNLNLMIKENQLKNKVFVIFGNSSGIGNILEKKLKEYSNFVYGFSRKSGVDIRNVNKIKTVLKQVFNANKRIDAIINTAAILHKKNLMNLSYKEIKEEIDTNLIGSINISKESFNYLKSTKGHLILFSSSSYYKGRKDYPIYSLTKSAISNLVQSLSEDWQKYGIKVNAIAPSRTDTPLRQKNFKDDKRELLSPYKVVEETLKVLCSNITGHIIDIKRIKK